MELSSLIKKIGHSLVEIRVRALKNILCKLDHSLISVNDIVQEKMLFVYLLEWFNFPEVPMKEEVLGLLLTLSKHPSAAQMLRDVGAVDFLTLLSPNLEPRLRTVIDGTLDQLFQLPELLPSHSAVYSHGVMLFYTGTHVFFSLSFFCAVNESVRCLKFSVFPWLALTNTDRHILSSNESSLVSTNPNLVRTTCELLCDVIMQDFPAEIFLQRPGIVKNLLSLLRLSSCKGEVNYLHSPALSCLRQLCVGLRRRLRFHQDPGFCSAKQDAVSQNSSLSYTQEVQGNQRSHASSPATERSPRPSVLGRRERARGDGQDGDAASDSGSSQRGGVAVQISNSPEHVAQLELPDLGAEDTLELQLQQLTLAQFTVTTLQHAIPLLKTGGKLSVFSLPNTLSPELFCRHSSQFPDKPQNGLHRLFSLLRRCASSNLQDNMATAIFHLSLDTSFGSLLPSMQEAAVAYLEQVNVDNHDVYRRITRAALWMESTCSFIKETQAEGEKNWLELLELADQATDGLPFHLHLPIIKHCVLMCSYLWRFDQPSPFLQTESQKLLLKMLSHPLLAVKIEAYERTLNLVKDCLGIQNVSRQEPAACAAVNFLLHHRVLYEISTFGLQDSAEKVSFAAKDILLFLLKGRLMMTASAWARFTEALHPVIPILQGYANTEESLGNCVLLISDTSDAGVLSNTAKLKAALRLLFSKKPTVRMAAVQQILPHITSGEDASTSRPDMDQSVIASLPNIFCGKNLVDVTLDTRSKSLLKVESVEKLFRLLSSDSVDISLKRSAAEQLSVVLQDTTMHPVLKSLGITDKVVSLMMGSVHGNKSFDCLLEPCACILRKLVYADPSLRHSLAQRNLLLLWLLRASLILKENKGNGSEIAVLMTLLLFDEIASSEMWLEKAATHHAVSPYRCLPAPSDDLLALIPARQALQVAWNTAWHSGINNLLEKLHGVASDANEYEFNPDLKLSESQLLSVRVAHLPSALRDCVQDIATAAGHRSVASGLSGLSLYLLIDRLALPHVPTYNCRDTLQSLSWHTALARFLQVRPACIEDERLLVGIVTFLNAYFKRVHAEFVPDEEDRDLRWILELLLNQETAVLLHLLHGVETQSSNQSTEQPEELKNRMSQTLQRELISFFNTLLLRLSLTTDRMCLASAGLFKSQLAVRLLQSLRVSDAPRFYGLPSLERTLQGMVSLTAQPGWSSHCPDLEPSSLCSKYLSGLLEVISSFYVEWGGNSLSFMGKGVTKNAVICLLHLSHEMMTENKEKDSIPQWYLGSERTTEDAGASPLGLAWLIPLWVDRDQEVRFASLGLGAALSSVASGCQALCRSCQNISGGLWGTLLNILLDQQETSMVRREAAFILQNLLVMPMPANAEEAKNSHWQHPCVHDEVSGISLVGLPALQALLHHCQYFQSVAFSATTCYRGRHTFHLPTCFDEPNGPGLKRDVSGGKLCSGSHTPNISSAVSIADEPPACRLTAQGQSDTDTSNSVTSQESQLSAVEATLIVTPDLLTAHCGVLTNLLAVLPDFVLTAIRQNQLLHLLANLVDVGLIEKCLTELRMPNVLPGQREDIKTVICFSGCSHAGCERIRSEPNNAEKFKMDVFIQSFYFGPHGAIFLWLCGSSVRLCDSVFTSLDAGIRLVVCACWHDVFTLLTALLKRNGSAIHLSVSAALARRWRSFAGTLRLHSETEKNHHLHTVALQFLSTVFTEETNRRTEAITNSERSSPLKDILNGPLANQLCESFLQSFERRSLRDPLKKLTGRALMTLLTCSPSAQNFASKAGLIDSCVEQLKQTYSQLESVRPGKVSLHKKVGIVWLETFHLSMSTAATDARLSQAVHALWPWLLLDDPTMEAALEALCVYTANCTTGLQARLSAVRLHVCSSSSSSSNSSLMHSVMKLTSLSSNGPIQNLAFFLLANLVASRDCRGILQKNNFLQAFLSVPVPKAPGVKATPAGGSGSLLGLWLRLLVSLSSAEDGQQSILKVTGSLEMLADLATHRRHALLILHNLCFCSANKSHVLTSDKAVNVLLSCLDSKDIEARCIGASALWALLHNNQRAKTSLKCPTVRFKIEEAYAVSKKGLFLSPQ
uniref:Rotatin n=1 Tax=Oryzias latipes TaxID=8090 RepID=A0A3P9JKF2_ORYLA